MRPARHRQAAGPCAGPSDPHPWGAEARRVALAGAAALVVSALLAPFLAALEVAARTREQGVLLIALVSGAGVAAVTGAYTVLRRRAASPGAVGLVLLASIGVVLLATYAFTVAPHVALRADILIWAETNFVADITKMALNVPLYGPAADNASSVYPPGAPLLTDLVARAAGRSGSIVAYRTIQVAFTVLAGLVAAACWWRLLALAAPVRRLRNPALWGALVVPFTLLAASNELTNPFVHTLHNDALAQLLAAVAYLVLVSYAGRRGRACLVLMAVLPAAGFFVKQSLALWLPLFTGYLALFDRPRSVLRAATVAGAGLVALGAVLLGCYLAWGPPFVFWTFTVLASLGVSPLRAVQHLLDTWAYWLAGFAAAAVLMRSRSVRPLVGLWAVWLALFLVELHTASVAWMRNHLGPGSLLAEVWLLVALASRWPSRPPVARTGPWPWLRLGPAVAALALLPAGLGMVRIPARSLPDDVARYVHDIEREFSGLAPDSVLLDAGSWLYLRHGVVMKDRVIAVGDLGRGGTGDFSGILGRLRERRYAKILVRDPYAPDFHYDHAGWPRSSGIREALRTSYREVRRIPGVRGLPHQFTTYFFRDISVLVPRSPTGSPP
jgi:hypothetical protein